MALVLLARQKRWRQFAFPTVLLGTALFIHALHRPWWPYYYLHLAIPLVWLAGFAIAELVPVTIKMLTTRQVLPGLGLALPLALAVAVAEARLEAGLKQLRHSPKASDSAVLSKMKEYAAGTHWIYAQPVIFPFHAGLPMPPELAVVMLKRFWSGQITSTDIVDICRHYRPEQLLLYTERVSADWTRFLAHDYMVAYQDRECVLFVAKDLPPDMRETRLQ